MVRKSLPLIVSTLCAIAALYGCDTGPTSSEIATSAAEKDAKYNHYATLEAQDNAARAAMATEEANKNEYAREQLEQMERTRRQREIQEAVCDVLSSQGPECDPQA
jgi:hypothetical protein